MQSSLGCGASKRSRGALSPRRSVPAGGGRRVRYNDVDDVIEEDEARGSKRFLSEVRRRRVELKWFSFIVRRDFFDLLSSPSFPSLKNAAPLLPQ